MKDIVFKEESYAIIGACFEVYNGCGFLEPVYQECLQIIIRDWNTSASHGRNTKRAMTTSPSDSFAFIRVIRGQQKT